MKNVKDLVDLVVAHPDIDFRYLVLPPTPIMPSWEILFPNPKLETEAVEQGKVDAEYSLSLGPGTLFERLVEHQINHRKVQRGP